MIQPFFLSLVLGILMVLSAGLTKYITPNILLAADRPAQKLDSIIPNQFGTWKEETNLASVVVTAQTDELLKKLYTQTLSRTYVNDKGERVMLSIAYGADQRDTTAVHYPEVCYPAQGFQIKSKHRGIIRVPQGMIPVKRLETNLANQRHEPVTYWTTVGDKVIAGPIDKKITEMKFSLKRQVPDGMVFRISSIDLNTNNAFLLQDSFVNSLVNALNSANKKRFMGID